MKKRALITGINGQDGSYLAEFLLSKGYEVHGILRRNSIPENQTSRIQHIYPNIKENLYHADLCDMASLLKVVNDVDPHEIYNLGAQSHVKVSFDQPFYTTETIVNGTLNLLEIIRLGKRPIKMYQASSSEMYGNSVNECGFQDEETPMKPVSPYGCAKLCAFNLVRCYRDSYGIFASNGILFNHESPRRGTSFVTNKIAKAAVEISLGLLDKVELGNLDAKRDWGHAKDYVKVMWQMLQLKEPGDFVCATGSAYTVQNFADEAFARVGLKAENHIVISDKYKRPNELHLLRGDASKLRRSIDIQFEYDSIGEIAEDLVTHWKDYYANKGYKV